MSKATTVSLKNKLDGNEIDLSLNQLTEVPVKELAAIPKATHLDLSCNHLQILPPDFATLTHLVKIDLSKNKLKELPENFGNLVNVQYLDLYGNELVELPFSFRLLKNLQWLDLKSNPLKPTFKAAAGDCLNENACRQCARDVVGFVTAIHHHYEEEQQKRLKASRKKEAIERAMLEKELEEKRRLKKKERERRKAESRAIKEPQTIHNEVLESGKYNTDEAFVEDEICPPQAEMPKDSMCSKTLLFASLFICTALILGFWGFHADLFSRADAITLVHQVSKSLQSFGDNVLKLIITLLPKYKEYFLKLVHQLMLVVTHIASQIEQFLSHYY